MKLKSPGFSIPMARKEASPIAELTARIVDSNGNELASKKSSPHGIENCQPAGASSLQRSNFSPDPSSCSTPNQDFKNFRKSSTPSRFLFFCDDSWIDFPCEVLNVLKAGFVAGRAILEVTVDNSSYIFDFQRMIQIDMGTGISNSIAWIDINGQCFFPSVAVDRRRNVTTNKRPPDCNNCLKRKRDEFETIEEHSDESPEPHNTASFDRSRWTGVELLGDGDRYYKVVEKLFLDGMRKFAPNTVITSIHKCLHSSPSGNSRLKAFQVQMEMTKASRGDDNVKFGWYGTSARDVAAVISHGFGQPNNSTLGSDACGVGIHLSPPLSPYASSLLSEGDANGERHVILCRVIMGKSEKVEAGSLQFHPSSEDFDSGVDDLENPKWYIIWSTCMNTRILPEYVVSFKSSKRSQDPGRIMSPSKKPFLTSLSFQKLFADMGRSLSSSQRQDIEIFYDHYKAGKVSKDTFIKHLRSTVGDKLLASIIRRIRGH